MRKWIAVASVVVASVVLTAATFVSKVGHGNCPLCWHK